jgi:nitrogen fixation/metabolism regulation signal transduction histidine kinase
MKPAVAKDTESNSLEDIGRATLQIVHDLKNQLNGLKLYATFLRKRLERNDQLAEERETVAKLIAGLDRSANEIAILVRYSQPIDLHRQAHADLRSLFENLARKFVQSPAPGSTGKQFALEIEPGSFAGEFDNNALSEAFIAIAEQASDKSQPEMNQPSVSLKRTASGKGEAMIEWRGVKLDRQPASLRSFDGKLSVRLALAGKIIEAHGGRIEFSNDAVRAWLPLTE